MRSSGAALLSLSGFLAPAGRYSYLVAASAVRTDSSSQTDCVGVSKADRS